MNKALAVPEVVAWFFWIFVAAAGIGGFVAGRMSAAAKLVEARAIAEIYARHDRRTADELDRLSTVTHPPFTVAEVHVQQLLALVAILAVAVRTWWTRFWSSPAPVPQYRHRKTAGGV